MENAQGPWTQKDKENERLAYVVVDTPGVCAAARAWVFDNEEDAVAFRTAKLEAHSRRPHSLTPVFCCTFNHVNMMGNPEIDWKKYPLPEKKTQKKFM